MMRAAIYCRLSEEDRLKPCADMDSYSIQNQKSMLLQYAMQQGWEVFGIYSDDDYAGADRKRPEFNRLLRDAENQNFDVVLCKTQSRFTRELEMVEKYIHGLFPLWGIRFVSIVDNADTDNKGNKKSRQINGLVNEWYLEDMSENIRSVLTNRRESGLHVGAFALYGYKKDPDQKGHLIIDETAAEVVHEIFQLFAEGYGKSAIAELLNEREIPAPAEYKRLQGLRYKPPRSQISTKWKYYTIADMLQNEMYIGNMVQGKFGSISYKSKENKPRPKEQWIKVENTHDAIIEQELWTKVQEIIKQNSKPLSVGTKSIFAGKIFCAGCGYAMLSSRSRGELYFKCPTHKIGEELCKGAFIKASELEQHILTALRELHCSYQKDNSPAGSEKYLLALKNQQKKLQEQIGEHQQRAADLTAALQELYIDKIKGVLKESEFHEFAESFRSEKSRLETLIISCEKEIDTLQQQIAAGDTRLALLEKYINEEKLTREMMDALIKRIEIGKRASRKEKYPIQIIWEFDC